MLCCVSVHSRIIAGAFGRHHASFEDAVFFVEGLEIGLIFSNESTSGRLPIRCQEQMEALHLVSKPIKEYEVHKAESSKSEDIPNKN